MTELRIAIMDGGRATETRIDDGIAFSGYGARVEMGSGRARLVIELTDTFAEALSNEAGLKIFPGSDIALAAAVRKLSRSFVKATERNVEQETDDLLKDAGL